MPRPERSRDHAADRSEAGGWTEYSRLGRPAPDEPLAASWDPVGEDDEHVPELDDEPHPERAWWPRGWRLYAIPLLVVLTALAVFEAADPQAGAPAGGSAAHSAAPDVPEVPVAPAAPSGQDPTAGLFSADLPPGAPFPVSGGRTFEVLPGGTPKVGGGDLYRYTVEVEVGVQLAEGNQTFAQLTDQTLADPRSWTNPQAGGIALQRVDGDGADPDFRVTLVSQNTAREICGYGSGLPYDTSCRIGDRVYINAARWVRGAVAFHGDMASYRRYAINHEVGHVFGNGHVPCGAPGGLAPVMMQQTFSTSNNELHELNKAVPQGAEIPANGFTCRYNAWPFPVPDQPGP